MTQKGPEQAYGAAPRVLQPGSVWAGFWLLLPGFSSGLVLPFLGRGLARSTRSIVCRVSHRSRSGVAREELPLGVLEPPSRWLHPLSLLPAREDAASKPASVGSCSSPAVSRRSGHHALLCARVSSSGRRDVVRFLRSGAAGGGRRCAAVA